MLSSHISCTFLGAPGSVPWAERQGNGGPAWHIVGDLGEARYFWQGTQRKWIHTNEDNTLIKQGNAHRLTTTRLCDLDVPWFAVQRSPQQNEVLLPKWRCWLQFQMLMTCHDCIDPPTIEGTTPVNCQLGDLPWFATRFWDQFPAAPSRVERYGLV